MRAAAFLWARGKEKNQQDERRRLDGRQQRHKNKKLRLPRLMAADEHAAEGPRAAAEGSPAQQRRLGDAPLPPRRPRLVAPKEKERGQIDKNETGEREQEGPWERTAELRV